MKGQAPSSAAKQSGPSIEKVPICSAYRGQVKQAQQSKVQQNREWPSRLSEARRGPDAHSMVEKGRLSPAKRRIAEPRTERVAKRSRWSQV